MSDWIGHECGVAAIRLRKPLDYYIEKYGTSMYGINKLNLLMEKQHNRGQDGAGAAVIKLDMDPGKPYIFRTRSAGENPLMDVRSRLVKSFIKASEESPNLMQDGNWVKKMFISQENFFWDILDTELMGHQVRLFVILFFGKIIG